MHRDDLAAAHGPLAAAPAGPLRVGIGGPVGGGKTALVAALCRALRDELSLAVVTNDIYTEEDAEFLRRHGVLPDDRIAAVRTGCCPHTAIRDDITANLYAVEALEARHDPDLVLVESGGDNLTATFSYGLVHAQIFVLDVAGGDKVPRKGGPGVTRSDLLVINTIDLGALVGADLEVMRADAEKVREGRPTVLVSLCEQPDAAPVAEWITAVAAGERPGVRWAWSPLEGPGTVLLAVGDPGAVTAVLDDARHMIVRSGRGRTDVAAPAHS